MERADLTKYDLPDEPGVYLFRGHRKEILYVGKATSLRHRVRSYFGAGVGEARGGRIVAMVERAAKIEWHITASVLEALILEANLIKRYQPLYNVDEKDDKSWNYVVITKEEFPRVLPVRGRELIEKWDASSIRHTFGPFPEGGLLKEALKIVRKIFPYRDTCTPSPKNAAKKRQAAPYGYKPCFNAQIGLCPGVCSGAIDQKEYARRIRHIAQLFSGNMKGLKRTLEREMSTAAKALRYEEAARLRRQISSLEHIHDVSLIKNNFTAADATVLSSRHGGKIVWGGEMRIEAYDIAHTAGVDTVGVMIVVVRGMPMKSSYRKFKIHSAKNDDPKALTELLSRRFAHPEWQYPRLIVVDGGASQMHAAQRVLTDAGIEIPVVGVVKDERHRPERFIGDERAIALHEREILLANAEAHRFAISWHRKRRGVIQ